MQRKLLSVAMMLATSATLSGPVNAQEQQPAPALSSGIDLQWLDTTVRPQDDFFRYMSGKWLASHEIPADRGRSTSFDALNDLSEQRCYDLITMLSEAKNLQPGSGTKKMADLYASFMNQKLADQRDLKPLHELFAQVDHLTKKEQLPALSAALSKLGISMPLTTYIGQDARDANRYAVYLSQGGLTLPDRDYYLKQDDAKMVAFRQAYLKHIQTMLELSGANDAVKSAADILALETAIAQLQWTRVENRDPIKTYNRETLAQLQDFTPNFDWHAYLVAADIGSKADYVIVRQPSFVQGLNRLILDTPLPVWKTYLKWRTLTVYAPYLSQRFVQENFDFTSKTLRGIPENRPRWKRGVAEVEAALPEALGKLYVEKYFPPANKARMEQLVSNLILAYRQSISSLSWMSEETRQQALTKLARFTPKIAYPDQWRDYTRLVIKSDDLVGNVERARQFENRRQTDKLGKPVDRTEWGMSPQTVNAYYNPRNNEIVFPAAILQPPFFNAQADDAVNYGGIGAVIGHEISHGFDDAGSQSDGDGNLRDWWSKDDKANFKKLTSALVEQYNAYSPLPGYHLNGALTLGENIADNSGLAIAYKAYLISLGGKPAPVIDGFTGEQRFYMGWAQVWRGKARDAETIRLINIDPHSPSAARGNLPLTNQPGFYSAFDLQPNDKMYRTPDQRIILW